MLMSSPAFRLDVVDMGVLAYLDGRHGPADVDAVLDHRVVGLQLADRELVADRDVVFFMDQDKEIKVHEKNNMPRLGSHGISVYACDWISLALSMVLPHSARPG